MQNDHKTYRIAMVDCQVTGRSVALWRRGDKGLVAVLKHGEYMDDKTINDAFAYGRGDRSRQRGCAVLGLL
jgi:hypothetical protein